MCVSHFPSFSSALGNTQCLETSLEYVPTSVQRVAGYTAERPPSAPVYPSLSPDRHLWQILPKCRSPRRSRYIPETSGPSVRDARFLLCGMQLRADCVSSVSVFVLFFTKGVSISQAESCLCRYYRNFSVSVSLTLSLPPPLSHSLMFVSLSVVVKSRGIKVKRHTFPLSPSQCN